jgi:hypothetical protein
VYNKARQAAITQELCEITVSAMCIEGGEDGEEGPALGTDETKDTVEAEFLEEMETGSLPNKAPLKAFEFEGGEEPLGFAEIQEIIEAQAAKNAQPR